MLHYCRTAPSTVLLSRDRPWSDTKRRGDCKFLSKICNGNGIEDPEPALAGNIYHDGLPTKPPVLRTQPSLQLEGKSQVC